MNHRQLNGRTSRREHARVIQEVGIDDCSTISPEQHSNLAVMAAKGRLTVEQINQLVEQFPSFAGSNRQAIENLKYLAAAAQASQQSALQSAEHILIAPWHPQGVVAEAARCAQSDEARLEIADMARQVGQQHLDGARTIERMNQDNNSLWRWMTGAAVGVAGITAMAVVAMCFLAAGDERSD